MPAQEENNNGGKLYKVRRGFKFPIMFGDKEIEESMTYKARKDDIFIVGYPRNGTHWMQQTVTLILNNGELPDIVKEKGLYAVSPHLEMEGKERAESLERPILKTHLPPQLIPKHDDAKYIVVLRNAKDACVSFFHLHKMFQHYFVAVRDKTFHDYVPLWTQGELPYGSYFDFYLNWWNNQHDFKHILFVVYEDLKRNQEENILKIASFLGVNLDKDTVEKIKEKTSVDYMRKNIGVKGEMDPEHVLKDEDFKVVRKGIIGDWESHMNQKESKIIEDKFREKFAGTELGSIWKTHGIFGC